MAIFFLHFRTWFAVKQMPEICQIDETKMQRRGNMSPTFFYVKKDSRSGKTKFSFNTQFCLPNKSLGYSFPERLLSHWDTYDLVTYWHTEEVRAVPPNIIVICTAMAYKNWNIHNNTPWWATPSHFSLADRLRTCDSRCDCKRTDERNSKLLYF